MAETSPQGIQGTVEDLERAARGVKAAKEIVDGVQSLLDDTSRSALVEFDNATNRPIRRVAHHADHGSWSKLPVDIIAPFSADVFASRSSGIMTGTTMTVDYALDDDGTVVHLYWEVPFVGGNDCSVNLRGPNAGFYEVRCMIAGGNTKVPVRFVVTEKALSSPTESDWRTCGDCKALFYALDDGRCPGKKSVKMAPVRPGDLALPAGAGLPTATAYGPHQAAGYVFRLPFGVPGPNREERWSRCKYCRMLYFDGWENKGVCPRNNTPGHVADPHSPPFVLPYDQPMRAGQQNDWRFCEKCYVLFYWPHGADGNCAAGGKHDPHPYNYVLQPA